MEFSNYDLLYSWILFIQRMLYGNISCILIYLSSSIILKQINFTVLHENAIRTNNEFYITSIYVLSALILSLGWNQCWPLLWPEHRKANVICSRYRFYTIFRFVFLASETLSSDHIITIRHQSISCTLPGTLFVTLTSVIT